MILDLRALKAKGKEESSFYFEYQPQEELVEIPEVEIVLPIKITGTVTLTGRHSAYIEGEIVFCLKGQCTRCLSDAERCYSCAFNEEVSDDNLDGYQLVNDTIDLTKMVNDTILTNLPLNFLCKEDCKGICAVCGANLNDGDCKCK